RADVDPHVARLVAAELEARASVDLGASSRRTGTGRTQGDDARAARIGPTVDRDCDDARVIDAIGLRAYPDRRERRRLAGGASGADVGRVRSGTERHLQHQLLI